MSCVIKLDPNIPSLILVVKSFVSPKEWDNTLLLPAAVRTSSGLTASASILKSGVLEPENACN